MPPNALLQEALRTGTVQSPDGNRLQHTGISPINACALYRTVLARRPKTVIEIGMSLGISTLTILTATNEIGAGELISVDPYVGGEKRRLVAVSQVEKSGFTRFHTHLRATSYAALPQLLASGTKAELVYIDGMHTFDHAFIDFFYADKLIDVGSVVAFNDCRWKSVFRVIRFLQTHRHYKELDVGLPRAYRQGNPILAFIERLEGRSRYDRYFEKVAEWDPKSAYYRRF